MVSLSIIYIFFITFTPNLCAVSLSHRLGPNPPGQVVLRQNLTMPRDALIVPQKQESVEELELPPENDVVFFNDNTEMAGPSFNSDMTALGGDFDAVRDFEGGSADQNFELPPPPSVVNVAKPSEDQPAVLWFDYKKDLVPENTPVLTWEVKRYKLNKDGRWSFKSSKIFHEKDFDPKKKTHKVSLTCCRILYYEIYIM